MNSVDTSNFLDSSVTSSIWVLTGQTDSTDQIRLVPIRTTPFTVGRKSDSNLCLRHNCVSKKHAEFHVVGGELWIQDAASTNGTYVNGEPITGQAQLTPGDLVQFASVVFRVNRSESPFEDMCDIGTSHEDTYDQALAMVQLERLISDRAVIPFFQPIVDLHCPKRSRLGYEVLGRSPLFGLSSPTEMFKTAAQLNLETELSRVFRSQGLELARSTPKSTALFFNTHPVELLGHGLEKSLRDLRTSESERPFVLEIHEAAMTNPEMIQSLRTELNDLRIQLAFDDFGAGQARLLELADVRPDYIKFDMKLIQGIHQAPPSRQQVVALLVRMVNELEIVPIAEGVETEEDHEVLRQMGVKLGQGFHYGRPTSINDVNNQV